MQIIRDEKLGEQITLIKRPNGLRVLVYEKPDFSNTYAMFATHFGSIDNCFRRAGESEFSRVPDGVAHFLEHKLFESEGEDAFVRYARTGASANAFTSFDKTAYLFSCTEQFSESFEILLDFVQHPYFTEQTVKKEQGIIGQEIRMYDDDPDWRAMFNLLAALYHNHPARIDIAGTVESIAEITPEVLYRCYETFYNPRNMVITVCGPVTADEVIQVCDRVLEDREPIAFERAPVEEPREVRESFVRQSLPVPVPLFCIGVKDHDVGLTGAAGAEHEALWNILLEALCGRGTKHYRELYDSGLIGGSFAREYLTGGSFAAAIVSGESRDPRAVFEKFSEKLAALAGQGLDADAFERARRVGYGRAVAVLDSTDDAAQSLMECEFKKTTVFEMIEAYRGATCEKINALLREIRPSQLALSVIESDEK